MSLPFACNLRGGLKPIALWLFMAAAAVEAGAQTPRSFLYVDTDNGNDATGNGSLTAPYRTLNVALGHAWDLRYDPPASPCSQPPTDTGMEVVVKVKATTTPVAPSGYGGHEADGWLTFAEDCQGQTRKPFPIRMIERVHIEGVRSGNQAPRVLIDESGGSHPFGATNWGGQPVLKRALFHAASSATLANLHLDGSTYSFKKTDRVLGVFAEGVSGFSVSNCGIDDLYDGLRFRAGSPSITTAASVVGCDVTSMGPLDLNPSSLNENQGHAGIWIEGSGSVDVAVSDSYFEGSHDAIEVAGSNMAFGRVSLTSDVMTGNENGLEIVGSGNIVVVVSDCEFVGNVNHSTLATTPPGMGMPLFLPDGTPLSPGALVARDMNTTLTMRSSTLVDNAFGIVANSPGMFDLGYTGSEGPGLNSFTFNLPAGDDPNNAVRTALSVGNPAAQVFAGGNVWYHLNQNQGTTTTGCLTGVRTGAPLVGDNLVPSPMLPSLLAPPGPTKGQCCDPATGMDWKRNYTLVPGASVDFGTDCLP